MTDCKLCRKPIPPGTNAVSIAGGMFPREDPDFFMLEPTVMLECFAHLQCLLDVVKGKIA